MKKFQGYAASLGKGQVEQNILISGPIEIQSLTGTFYSMSTNITRREEELKERENLLNNILENHPCHAFFERCPAVSLCKIQSRNHGERYLHTKKISIIDKQGNPTFLLGISEDITEQRQIEAALRKSKEKHRILIETMAQGVVYQNADGKIVSANPAAERILGLTLDQMYSLTSMDPSWMNSGWLKPLKTIVWTLR